jgi:hypothetical protein
MNLLWEYTFPKEKNYGTDFGCVVIQSNGEIAHVEIKGGCMREFFSLLQHRAYFWDWDRFSFN